MKKKGFTLMELLIVISIIAILVSVSLVSYSSAQKKGRDARRHTDLKAMQTAWEQYYADNNGNYPNTCSVDTTYLPGGLPVDPKTGDAYTSTTDWYDCTTTTYCICAALEGETNSKPNCAGTGLPTGYVGFDCVRNLQ